MTIEFLLSGFLFEEIENVLSQIKRLEGTQSVKIL